MNIFDHHAIVGKYPFMDIVLYDFHISRWNKFIQYVRPINVKELCAIQRMGCSVYVFHGGLAPHQLKFEDSRILRDALFVEMEDITSIKTLVIVSPVSESRVKVAIYPVDTNLLETLIQKSIKDAADSLDVVTY